MLFRSRAYLTEGGRSGDLFTHGATICIKNDGFLDRLDIAGYPMGAVPVKLNPVFGSPLFVVKVGPR